MVIFEPDVRVEKEKPTFMPDHVARTERWIGSLQAYNRDLTIRQRQRQRRRLLSKRTTAHTFHLTLALSREGANVSEFVLPFCENTKSVFRRKEKIGVLQRRKWPRNRGNVIFELYFTLL